MSALLAVERFADHLVDTLGLPPSNVTELFLRECNNLAMPGLVVGFLVRHIDQTHNLLDPWLSRPELWSLEFQRVVVEGQLHVQGPDPAELVGRDKRRFSFREVSAQLTLRAMLARDNDRLTALAAVADELLDNARTATGADDAEELAAVMGWASTLRPEHYQAHRAGDGGVIIQYEPPAEVTSALAPSSESFARSNEAVRLQVAYSESEDRVAPIETLLADLRVARRIAEDPPIHGPLHPMDPVAAVAAAAIVAHADGRASVPEEDLRWSADILIEAATNPVIDTFSIDESVFPTGADRSAAVALPALLLPEFRFTDAQLGRLEDALHASAISLFDEVRMSLATGLSRVWTTPCHAYRDSDPCIHTVAWEAVQAGLRDCRLGTWTPEAQRRPVDPLEGPYTTTLPEVATDSLRLNRLIPSLIAVAGASQSESCVADESGVLFDVLVDAFRRSSLHWAIEGFGGAGAFHDRRRQAAVRVLVDHAVAGHSQALVDHVRAFTSSARALDQLLRDLATIFTYDDSLRQALTETWRTVMTAALDAIAEGADLTSDRHWSDGAIAGLLPTPQLDIGDTNPDATLERAGRTWVHPDAIADLVSRWLPIARHEPKALDALAQLARYTTPGWQTYTGLSWAEDLIAGQYDMIAGRCWFLVDWLSNIRSSEALDAEGWARWRRIVDGLAAEGDRRAVDLQLAEE